MDTPIQLKEKEIREKFIEWNKKQSPSGLSFFIADWWLKEIASLISEERRELSADFIKSGERQNLIDMAEKYPNSAVNCIDSAYLHGLESAKEIVRRELEEAVKGMKKDTHGVFEPIRVGDDRVAGIVNHGFNLALSDILSLLKGE